jgi:hypothetical protein
MDVNESSRKKTFQWYCFHRLILPCPGHQNKHHENDIANVSIARLSHKGTKNYLPSLILSQTIHTGCIKYINKSTKIKLLPNIIPVHMTLQCVPYNFRMIRDEASQHTFLNGRFKFHMKMAAGTAETMARTPFWLPMLRSSMQFSSSQRDKSRRLPNLVKNCECRVLVLSYWFMKPIVTWLVYAILLSKCNTRFRRLSSAVSIALFHLMSCKILEKGCSVFNRAPFRYSSWCS